MLDGWLGPTLFTQEAARVPLATFRPGMRGHARARWLVIGTTREPDDDHVYAAFCADPVSGRVVLVDVDAPFSTRHVNASVGAFVACVEMFVRAWPPDHVDRVHAELGDIDPTAMDDPDALWPTLLETTTSD
jgi:hypothetical protein